MYLYLAIAIPFLFVIGTIYSAIKEQRKLEKTTLQDILNKEQKKRLLHYKKHVASIDFDNEEHDIKQDTKQNNDLNLDHDIKANNDLDSDNVNLAKQKDENKYAFNIIKASSREYNTALLDKEFKVIEKDKKENNDCKDDSQDDKEDIYDASKLLDYDSYDKNTKNILNKVDSLLDKLDNK